MWTKTCILWMGLMQHGMHEGLRERAYNCTRCVAGKRELGVHVQSVAARHWLQHSPG